VKFHCPFCDYSSGNRGSVEGHISGKSDSSHKGRVGRSHRSDIIEEAEPDSLGDRIASITGGSAAMEKSAQEEIHRLRADLQKLDEKLSQRIDNLEATINARPDTDTLREQAVEDVKGGLKAELEAVQEQQQEALDEFRETTEGLRDRLIRESRRSAEDEVSSQNEAINKSLRQMAVMLSTLPTNTKVQCPKCGSYVKFKEKHKITGSGGTNLACPDCTTELINELPPSINEKDEYV
jgi:predicted Zn-ribbon and HTH transcriptional regulator